MCYRLDHLKTECVKITGQAQNYTAAITANHLQFM